MKLVVGFALFLSSSLAWADVYCSVKEKGTSDILWQGTLGSHNMTTFRLVDTKFMLSTQVINGKIYTISVGEDVGGTDGTVEYESGTDAATMGFYVPTRKVGSVYYEFTCELK